MHCPCLSDRPPAPRKGRELLSQPPLLHSLTVRLHETLKQCQDLRTEKGQMDRKISQLSEENGDLSFKVTGGLGRTGCVQDWRHQESAAKTIWPETCLGLQSPQRPACFAHFLGCSPEF